jgi:hypothetical protein
LRGCNRDRPEDGDVRTLHCFKVVHVFDVSQTEEKELPEFAAPSGDPGENLSKIETLVATYGIALRYDAIPSGALGVSQGGEIVVRPDLAPA